MTTSVFLLHAAAHAAAAIPITGTTRTVAAASYRATSTGGLYRADDLQRGQALLLQARLLTELDGVLTPTPTLREVRKAPIDVAAELILRELLLVERPLWLWAAMDRDRLLWEHVPGSDQQLIDHLLQAERREAFLLAVAQTVDTKELAELGATGEDIVVDACRTYLTGVGRGDLSATVARVSRVSDQLGYDVTSADTGGKRHRMEVKTVRDHLGSVSFFISSNEALQARRDPLWSLVIVAADRDKPVVGWCAGTTFLHLLPVDVEPNRAAWASARVTVDISDLTPGLPLDAR